MGAGSNRMNKYTVGMATQGLSNYLIKCFVGKNKSKSNNPPPITPVRSYPSTVVPPYGVNLATCPPKAKPKHGRRAGQAIQHSPFIKVAIAYDSRNNSDYFAKITANVFSSNGFKVYIFESLRPTPELSFAMRQLGCQSGVVITASHNPKEYNGYKAYWDDGAQIIAPHDKNIINEIRKIKSIDEIAWENGQTDKMGGIEYLGEKMDNVYLNKILSLSVSRQAIKNQKDLKIVYTPIHGSGNKLVPQVLKKFGFNNVTVVDEQAEPDGNFPTVEFPNPEEPAALKLALKKAKAIDADLVLATDPDADRVGAAVKKSDATFVLLNGNQIGSLLVYYLINSWKSAGKLTGKEYVVKTIVTTDLIERIAEKNNVKCYNTLTGFKHIASLIRKLEGKEKFIAGGEESYGYLVGDFVRDKDAIISCAFIAEFTAYAKDKGLSLYDTLINMYIEYGFYKERLVSITKKGKSGAEEIQQMMTRFRNNPPSKLGDSKVVLIKDYQSLVQTEFPKSNVIQFITEDGSKISARPSGTEPKIKFYFSVHEELSSKDDFDNVDKMLEKRIDKIICDLGIN
ncbi:MAG: phospho-sugar mutase [Cytophagales bacterium]|nr:phospho-sugar mutase [Cytophagales bacterium]